MTVGPGRGSRRPRTSRAPARSGGEVVGVSGLQPRPLGDGASVGPVRVPAVAATPLRPAGGRVLPRLLASMNGQVEDAVAVVHRLDAAAARPVGLEHGVALA